jgi:hypothetical protein
MDSMELERARLKHGPSEAPVGALLFEVRYR